MNLLLFTHANVLAHLGQVTPCALASDTPLIELSQRPHLAYRLGMETPADYPGLLGLLHSASNWSDWAVSAPELGEHRLILAPAQASVPLLLEALVSAQSSEALASALLLMPWSALTELQSLVPYVEHLALAWDQAVLPPVAADELGAQIGQACVRAGQWAGCRFYDSTRPDQPAQTAEVWLQAANA